MKIKELIEILQNQDENLEVLVDGYHSGYDEVTSIYTSPVESIDDTSGGLEGKYNHYTGGGEQVLIVSRGIPFVGLEEGPKRGVNFLFYPRFDD